MIKGNQYRFLCLLFLSGYFVVYAENDLQQDLCKNFEMIDPNASQKSYVALAQEFRKAKLTLCDCIKAKIGANIGQERANFSQQWNISQQDWKDIDAIKEKVRSRDAQSGPILLESQEYHIPEEQKQNIIAPFRAAGFNNGFIKINKVDALNNLETFRPVSITQNYGAQGVKIGPLAVASGYHVGLSDAYFSYSDHGMEGNMLQQTKGHVAYNSSLEKDLILYVCRNKKINVDHVAQSSSFNSYKQALENRADQVPAACGINARDATLIEAWLNDLSKYEKIKQERLDTAKRIRRFKQAEEHLSKKP